MMFSSAGVTVTAVADQLAADGHVAAVGEFQVVDQPQQRGLAGAGRANQHGNAAGAQVQVHVLQHRLVAEYLADAMQRHRRALARFNLRGDARAIDHARCSLICGARRRRDTRYRALALQLAARKALLHPSLQQRQHCQDHQVPDRGHHQQRHHFQVAPTTEVLLARPITSLNAAGRIERIACGRMMRRTWRPRGRPSAAAASYWPWSTDRMPPRITSAENAAWFNVRPSTAAVNTPISWVVGYENRLMPVNGTPSSMVLYR
ncbi:hypothetical protein G6F65_018086 [Rhizopus arrhizus]|nr:hypothetical protein G6F65_018086 [Rhizopus arrhizus]